MIIVIILGSIFMGFTLGFATMALLAARGHRLQCEARGTRSYFRRPRVKVAQGFRPVLIKD
jgi:hypothetical protein